MTATSLKDFERWPSGILAADIPANNNAMRLDVLNRPIVSATVLAQPGSPADGDLYIIPASASGAQWATFAIGSLAYFKSGTWYEYTPYEGLRKYSTATNTYYRYDLAWSEETVSAGAEGGISISGGSIGGDVLTAGFTVNGLVAAGYLLSGNWRIWCEPAGAIELDVRVCPFASLPPDIGDSICATDEPAVASGNSASGDYSSSNWSTTLNRGDAISVVVLSVTDVTWFTLLLEAEKT